ncbi:sperm-associated antigen 5 isoform X3 [Clupea harengus]|uniref:Sperm-associated antigen 5 isoform X3 n=1 Tax=Clupea harengus TaxID=7950 RepID=A0A6P8EVC9_CLUHA|nr:sperm-associated antigen 5 isoform X3 [Clupea harengus]
MSTLQGSHVKEVSAPVRTPLRDVQNELLASQQQTHKNKSLILSERTTSEKKGPITSCHSAEHYVEDTTSEMQKIHCAPESTNETSQMDPSSSPTDDQCAFTDRGDMTYTFLGGEIQLSDTLDTTDATQGIPLDNNSHSVCTDSELEEGNIETFQDVEPHFDHPYYQAERSTISSCDVPTVAPSVTHMSASPDNLTASHLPVTDTDGVGDITFKSFVCSDVEIEVSGTPDETSELSALLKNLTVEGHQALSQSNGGLDEGADVLLNCSQHVDHPYCNVENNTTGDPAVYLGHESQALEEDLAFQMHSKIHAESLLYFEEANTDAGTSNGQNGDITFKSFMCMGGEVDILEDASRLSEKSVVIMEEKTLENSEPSVFSVTVHEGETSAAVPSGEGHADHPYSEIQMSFVCDSPAIDASLEIPVVAEKAMDEESCSDQIINREESAVLSYVQDTSSCTNDVSAKSSAPVTQVNVMTASPAGSQHALQESAVLSYVQDTSSCTNDVSAKSSAPVTQDNVMTASPAGSQHALQESAVLSYVQDTSSCTNDVSAKSSAPVTQDNMMTASPAGSQHALQERSSGDDSALGSSSDPFQAFEGEPEELRRDSPQPALGETLSVQFQELSAPSTPRASFLSRSLLLDPPDDEQDSRLWAGALDSPLPPPQLNSTALPSSLICMSVPPSPSPPAQTLRVAPEPPTGPSAPHVVQWLTPQVLLGGGPLQEQMRQMAELLIAASGKHPTTPVNQQSACVGTSPLKCAERSMNTSVVPEVEVPVADVSTSTDSLLWNLSPGSLECLPRAELEQRLTSYLIMSEALLQQVASARAQPPSSGPAPSDLRDKLIQTDHTELSQMETYKDLYVVALDKIQSLQLDLHELESLRHNMQATSSNMVAIKTDTEEALSSMKDIGDIVSEDQKDMSKQMSQMKSLYGKCRETLRKMQQKTRDCLEQRDDMRSRMDEALQAKEAAFSVVEQLRGHSAARLAELEESVGSHQQLREALRHSCPLQAALNKDYVETLAEAKELLKATLEDHASLQEELGRARHLLQRTRPVLLRLHQRASDAVDQSELCQREREQALEDRDQIQQEREQTQESLQDAGRLIGDLNTQLTILNAEMTVLRQQLEEVEEERDQLQRRSTELSATVTSTMASYAFLEQALGSETKKMQQSMHEAQETRERASGLEQALEASQGEVLGLTEALAQRDGLVSELRAQAEVHTAQLRQLQKLKVELSSSKEMNEFLQMENELTQEQMSESEGMLRTHLQGLRERNLECEDLKLALSQLRQERDSLAEELDSTSTSARAMLLEQGEQLAQASKHVTMLHHHMHCFTSTLELALSAQAPEASTEDESPEQPASFVDSILKAITHEEEQQPSSKTSADTAVEDEPTDGLGSTRSAFSRVPSTTPRKERAQESSVVQVVTELTEMFTKLTTTIQQLQQHQDTDQEKLHKAKEELQEQLREEAHRHRQQEQELREQLQRLQAQVEKDAAALQQKAQDEKTLNKLCGEMDKNMEQAQKQRAETMELRREGAELRQALQQSQVEAQALKEELNRAVGQSAPSTKAMDERIRLLKEVEKLKQSLAQAEESRSKLMDRAKRHQTVHVMNQTKLERELHLLDDMIETVRKTMISVPHVVKNCVELQKLVEFLG